MTCEYDDRKLKAVIRSLQEEIEAEKQFVNDINEATRKKDQRIAELEKEVLELQKPFARGTAEFLKKQEDRFCITGEVSEIGDIKMLDSTGSDGMTYVICGLTIVCHRKDLQALKESPLYRKVGIVILEDEK